jgi:hypothetical protein
MYWFLLSLNSGANEARNTRGVTINFKGNEKNDTLPHKRFLDTIKIDF